MGDNNSNSNSSILGTAAAVDAAAAAAAAATTVTVRRISTRERLYNKLITSSFYVDRMPLFVRSTVSRILRPHGYTGLAVDLESGGGAGDGAQSKVKSTPTAERTWSQQAARHTKLALQLLPFLWPKNNVALRLRAVCAMFFLILSKVINVLTPFAYKGIVDVLSLPREGGSESGDSSGYMYYPWLFIVLYGAGSLGTKALDNLRDSVFVHVQQNAMASSAVRTFSHLHNLSIGYHLQRKTGGVLRGIDRGTRSISFLTNFFFFSIAPIILEVGMISIVLLFRLAWISLVIVVVVIAYTVFTLAITEWRTKYRRMMNDMDNEANDKAVDSLLNYETVKCFSNEPHEIARYKSSIERYNAASIASQNSLSVLNIGQSGIISMGQLIVMLITAWFVVHGDMTVGDLVLTNTYVLQVYGPLSFLGSSYRIIKQSLIDLESMFDLLDQEPDLKDPEHPEPCAIDEGEISFDDVRFAYKGKEEQEVLKGVSFTVKPGKQLAIVGSSGAGKTTINRLLFRFYDATAGRITIDGQDISHMRQHDLRKNIGIVPQDCVLFNDTILYNIRYGNLEATNEQVAEAAKMANILDFIESLPDKWETKVGERGLRLSGGEKQRVSIARCLLKNAPIVVFDEATSALDSTTEKEIQDNLRDAFKGKTTTIVLAHRLSTIIDSDEIIVMDKGQIAERGKFEELLQVQDGLFAKLWRKQSEKAEERKRERGDELDEQEEEETAIAAVAPVAQRSHHHHH